MRAKKFEYHHKDIPVLKRDIAMRITFTIIFFAIFIWQFISLLVTYTYDTLTTPMILASAIVMVSMLTMCAISFSYAFKSVNIISDVKRRGRAVRSVSLMFGIKKNSFVKIYSILTQLIALVMVVLMTSAITYSILQYIYYSTMSYYIPILVAISICGFNSVYHISFEIERIKTVELFNAIY